MRVFLCLMLAASCGAQVRQGRFENRDAWILESARLRVAILQSGGHVAGILLKEAGAVNPLWVQGRPTIDAEQYEAARHGKFYGGGAGARLMAGLMGHNLCFPFWGNPSPSEAAAGMTFHGETGVVRWRLEKSAADSLTITADLPESRTRFTRTVRIADDLVWFDETAENMSAWDRPVGWCEHVTLGAPFLERGVTRIAASLGRGRGNGKEFQWPQGMAEEPVDLRTVRNRPSSPGFVNNFLVDPAREHGFFAAFHPRYRMVFGYVFPRAQFPWLNVWEANSPEMLTRGMEFSNTPVHGTMKALVASPEVFGAPAFEWLDARGRLHKRFAAFVRRVPEGYKGVADVRLAGEKLEIKLER